MSKQTDYRDVVEAAQDWDPTTEPSALGGDEAVAASRALLASAGHPTTNVPKNHTTN